MSADAGRSDAGVTLRYRSPGEPAEAAIVCRFAPPAGFGLPELANVRTSREGELSGASLFFLNRFLSGSSPGSEPAAGSSAYLLQQLANALVPCAIYALLATGYALIWGLTGRINLAFGDFTTVGAFASIHGLALSAAGFTAALPAGVSVALLLATATGAALGVVLHGIVFAPLWRRSSQALLIASIGLAIALSEALRLIARSRQTWLPPFAEQPLALLRTAEGEVTLSLGQVLLALLAAAAVAGVILLLRRTAFGRNYRACADDAGAAALVGVDVDRVLRHACMLGGAAAGLAGFVVAARYGVVAFGMGTFWGFKALAAAIIGGIGSIPGAALGGLLLGLLEGLWAAYLPGAYRDGALFLLLALVLAVRPGGLLGGAGDDQPGSRKQPLGP